MKHLWSFTISSGFFPQGAVVKCEALARGAVSLLDLKIGIDSLNALHTPALAQHHEDVEQQHWGTQAMGPLSQQTDPLLAVIGGLLHPL